jgi:hypothetical protein
MHLHSAYDLYGMKYLIESNYDIAAAIREGDVGSRQLLLDQVRQKFGDLDNFLLSLATNYRTAAAELALI